MNRLTFTIAVMTALIMSSCRDTQDFSNSFDSTQKTIIVEGQSAKSVLTLGCLLANHTTLPAGSRATDYGYEYDDDDGVFMSEAEAAALLAPYTQMGNELRRALLLSYFPDKPASRADGGEGGEGDDGGDDEPWRDPTQMENLPDDQQDEVNMLCELTDEEVTEVAIILSSMAFDDSITQLNGYAVSMGHTIGCLLGAFVIPDLEDLLGELFKGSFSNSGRRLLLQVSKKSLIRLFGRVAGKLVPGVNFLLLAKDISDFVDCMLNPDELKISESEYEQLLAKYEWLTEYDTIDIEIVSD